MSALALYNSKNSKITSSSSPIEIREKSVGIVLTKKGEEGSLVKVKKKISENNSKLILVTNKLNRIQKFKVRIEKVKINDLKVEPAAEQKVQTEKFLEKTPEKKEKKREGLDIPKPKKPNLFDRLFKYLALTGLNWLVGKLSDKASGITGIFDFIQKVLENIVAWFPKFLDATFKFFETVGPWIQKIGQFVFNAFVGAIDLAYQTYDGLRSLTGTIFGEKVVERFDEFSGVLSNVIAGAITLGTAMIMFSDDLKGSGNKDGRLNKTKTKDAAKRKYIQRYGRKAAEQRFGKESIKKLGGRYARSGATNLARKGLISTLGRSGTKAVLKTLRPIFKRIPVVGGLIDFVVSLAMGESLGRAAAKSVGATLGAALGSLIPIPGVGTIAGGILGDLVGGSIYDAVTGNDEDKEQDLNNGGRVKIRSQDLNNGGRVKIRSQDLNNGGRVKIRSQDLNNGGRVKIGAQDFRDLAYIVSGEAARGTNDEYGVAAAVLNRVASPVWPNTVKQVGSQAGQFEAVYTGKAKDDPELAEKLASPQGQSSITSAMRLLNGRTDFKGQSMLSNKGSTDIMFHPRGNFFHYTSQRGKNDPVPANPNQSWKRMIGFGGPKIDLKTTTSSAQTMGLGGGGGKQKDGAGIPSILNHPLMKLFKKLNIDDFNVSGTSGNNISKDFSVEDISDSKGKKTKTKSGGDISAIGSPPGSSTSPAQISSSPSPSLSATKTNITKTAQSLPYQKVKVATKVAVLVKEKTRNILT